MEKYRKSIELAERITRYLKGDLSDTEMLELEKSLEESSDGTQLLTKISDQKNIADKQAIYESFDANKSWDKIRKVTGRKVHGKIYHVFWYAAILMLPLMVAASVWYIGRVEELERPQYIVDAYFESHKTILELPGGLFVDLDTVRNIAKKLIYNKKKHTIFTKRGLYMFYQIIILFVLILFNAYFAATEIAFISLSDSKINKMSKEGNKKAKQIEQMLQNPSKFLATIQIGVTLAGFLSSAFASDAFANQLASGLNSIIPSVNIEVLKGFSIVLITIILSYFTLVFGELVPKRLAMKYYEKIAFTTISPFA